MSFLVVMLSAMSVMAIGMLAMRWLWPGEQRRETLLLRIVLAGGVGGGLVSLLFFVGLPVVGHASRTWIIGSELGLLIALLVANRRLPNGVATVAAHHEPAALWIRALSVAAIAGAAIPFVLATLRDPHGVADALTIWNLRAHLLFAGGEQWRQQFDAEFGLSHPDYPLLVPALIARTWCLLGEPAVAVSGVVSGCFAFATPALLWASLRTLRSPSAGWLAAGALAGFPAFFGVAALQLVDHVVAFFYLATIIALSLHDRWRRADRRLVVIAGCMLGFAAWTKNEGLLFAVVLPAARAFALWRRGDRAWRTEWAALAAGAAPAMLALLVFKTVFVPPNDLVQRVVAGPALDNLLDWTRWVILGKALAVETWTLGPMLLVALLLWCTILRRERLLWPLLVAGLMLLGFLATFLCASQNISWHLSTALQRLLLQLLPMVLFSVFSGREIDDR